MSPMNRFGLPDHLRRLSATGDPLEVLERVIDFERFRVPMEAALSYSDRAQGGRPPYDPVVMFKVLILAALHEASDEQMEFLIRDRLSWLRFLGFELGLPRAADDSRCDEGFISDFRADAGRGGLSGDGWAGGRFDLGLGTSVARRCLVV